MRKTVFIAAILLSLASTAASAQNAPAVDPAKVEAIMKAMFAKVSPEWQARAVLDETQKVCTEKRNQVSAAEADAIQKREMASVVPPADGKYLGDWKKGFQVANIGTFVDDALVDCGRRRGHLDRLGDAHRCRW